MSQQPTERRRPSQMHQAQLNDECSSHVEFRNLPASGFPRFKLLVQRALMLRCPYCGSGGVIHPPFGIETCCPKCGYRFAPEDGYFMGGYAMNLIVAELLGVGFVLYLLIRSDLSLYQQEFIAIAFAVLLPILFFPFSRTLWMAMDLMIQGDRQPR